MRASYAPRDVWKGVSRTPLRATPHYVRADPTVESVVKRYCRSAKRLKSAVSLIFGDSYDFAWILMEISKNPMS